MDIFADLNKNELNLIEVKSSVNKYLNYCNMVRDINRNLYFRNCNKELLDYKKFISKSEMVEDLKVFFDVIYMIYKFEDFQGEQTFKCIEKNVLYETQNIDTITCWDLEQLISRQFRFIEDRSLVLNEINDIYLNEYDNKMSYYDIPIINMRDERYNENIINDYKTIIDLRGYDKYMMDDKFYRVLNFLYSEKKNKIFMLMDEKTKGLGECLVFVGKHIDNALTIGTNTCCLNENGVFEEYILPNSKIILKVRVKSFYDVLEKQCDKSIFIPDITCKLGYNLDEIREVLL